MQQNLQILSTLGKVGESPSNSQSLSAAQQIIGSAAVLSRASYQGVEASSELGSILVGSRVSVMCGKDDVREGTVTHFMDHNQEVGVLLDGQDVPTVYRNNHQFIKKVTKPSEEASLEGLRGSAFHHAVSQVMWSHGESVHPHCVARAKFEGVPSETLVIACRGPVTSQNYYKELLGHEEPKSTRQDWTARVHSGVLSRCETIALEPFVAHLDAGGSVLFTGHSLGSAVAELCCLKVVMHYHNLNDHDVTLRRIIAEGRLAFVGFASLMFVEESVVAQLSRMGAVTHIFHHVIIDIDTVPFLGNLPALVAAASAEKKEAMKKGAVKLCTMTVQRLVEATPYVGWVAGGLARDHIKDAVEAVGAKAKGPTVPNYTAMAGYWYIFTLGYNQPKVKFIESPSEERIVAPPGVVALSEQAEIGQNALSAHFLDVYFRSLAASGMMKERVEGTTPEPVSGDVFQWDKATAGHECGASWLPSKECITAFFSLQEKKSHVAVFSSNFDATVKDLTLGVTHPLHHLPYARNTTLLSAPFIRQFRFELSKRNVRTDSRLALSLRLESTYVVLGSVPNTTKPTVVLEWSSPILITTTDGSLSNILRQSLFLSFGDNSDPFIKLLRCQLMDLEATCMQHVVVDQEKEGGNASIAEKYYGMPIFLGSPERGRMSLMDVPSKEKNPPLSWLYAPPRVSLWPLSAIFSIQKRSGDPGGIVIQHQETKLFIKKPGEGESSLHLGPDSDALVLSLEQAEGNLFQFFDPRTEKFLMLRRSKIVFSVWGLGAKGEGNRFFQLLYTATEKVSVSTNTSYETTVAKQIFPQNIKLDAVALCARYQVQQYVLHNHGRNSSQNQRSSESQIQIARDPAAFLKTPAVARHVEMSKKYWDLTEIETNKILSDVSKRQVGEGSMSRVPTVLETLRTLQRDRQPWTVPSSDEADDVALPPKIPLATLYARWDEVQANPPAGTEPPLTRFYFCGLPSILYLAFTVLHVAFRAGKMQKDETGAAAIFQKLRRWWTGANTDLQDVDKDYKERLFYLCTQLKSDEFSQHRAFTNVPIPDPMTPDFDAQYAKLFDVTLNHALLREFHSKEKLEHVLFGDSASFESTHKGMERVLYFQGLGAASIRSVTFVYQMVIRLVQLEESLKRACVISVYGLQKTGKSTLLQGLTNAANIQHGAKNAFSTASAMEHTTEPAVIPLTVKGGTTEVHCDYCHSTHDPRCAAHLGGNQRPIVMDLPGINDDASERGTLQALMLGVVRALIVLHTLHRDLHNEKIHEALHTLDANTPIIVLFVHANELFTRLNKGCEIDGVPVEVRILDHKVYFEWRDFGHYYTCPLWEAILGPVHYKESSAVYLVFTSVTQERLLCRPVVGCTCATPGSVIVATVHGKVPSISLYSDGMFEYSEGWWKAEDLDSLLPAVLNTSVVTLEVGISLTLTPASGKAPVIATRSWGTSLPDGAERTTVRMKQGTDAPKTIHVTANDSLKEAFETWANNFEAEDKHWASSMEEYLSTFSYVASAPEYAGDGSVSEYFLTVLGEDGVRQDADGFHFLLNSRARECTSWEEWFGASSPSKGSTGAPLPTQNRERFTATEWVKHQVWPLVEACAAEGKAMLQNDLKKFQIPASCFQLYVPLPIYYEEFGPSLQKKVMLRTSALMQKRGPLIDKATQRLRIVTVQEGMTLDKRDTRTLWFKNLEELFKEAPLRAVLDIDDLKSFFVSNAGFGNRVSDTFTPLLTGQVTLAKKVRESTPPPPPLS